MGTEASVTLKPVLLHLLTAGPEPLRGKRMPSPVVFPQALLDPPTLILVSDEGINSFIR